MKTLALVAGLVGSMACGSAWAINKCTGADGQISFQDKACPGQGETVGEEIARREQERQRLLAQQKKEAEARAALAATTQNNTAYSGSSSDGYSYGSYRSARSHGASRGRGRR